MTFVQPLITVTPTIIPPQPVGVPGSVQLICSTNGVAPFNFSTNLHPLPLGFSLGAHGLLSWDGSQLVETQYIIDLTVIDSDGRIGFKIY